MGRKSRGRGGTHSSRGRRGGGRSVGPVGGRRARTSRYSNTSQGEADNAPLHIGGLQIHCDGDSVHEISSRRRRQGRRQAPAASHDSSDQFETSDGSDSDDVTQDYVANLQYDSDTNSADVRHELQVLEQFTAARAGRQVAVEDMEAVQGLADELDETTSSSSDDDEDSDHESGSSDSMSDISIDDLITDLGGGLSLMEQYPVLYNDVPVSSNPRGSSARPGIKKKGGAVKGANKGKLAPGEKKRLKKEKMNAKRAARAAGHGLDLESVNAELIHFVASRGDMKGFPPMSKFGLQTVMRLASCYGLKASAQGSGKNKFVVIASCERTHLPTGREADKVKSILKEQARSEAAVHVFRKGSQTGSRPVRKSFGSGPQPARFNQPISFVSSGIVGGDPMEIRPALQPTQIDSAGAAELSAAAEPSEAAEPSGAAEPSESVQPSQSMQDAAAAQPDADASAILDLDLSAASPQAPWHVLDPQPFDPSESAHPGLGCSPLPEFEYPEDCTAGLGSGPAMPLYDRLDSNMLGSAERDLTADTGQSADILQSDVAQTGEAPEDREEQLMPHGGNIYESWPGMPQSFMVKQDVKRASKKQQKLARRAERGQLQQNGSLPSPQPTSVATNLRYGKFEQHTTGYGSRMLARWGFSGQGSGLGKDQQGIAEPVTAFVRPKKQGLGHGSAL